MPQIAGLPINEPVALPQAKPAQFGSVGEAVAGLGEETERLAAGAVDVEQYLAAANRQLKLKQAEIAVERVKSQVHDDLRKATTPEEIDAIYEYSKEQVATVLPAVGHDRRLAQTLGLYQQQQDVEIKDTANARKAHVITEADNAANATIGQSKLAEAINTKAGGGDPSVPRAQFELQLQSSVSHGTITPAQANEVMQKWDAEYEAGLIDTMISGTDLQQIQNTVNDIRLHPENYPHLSKAELNQLAHKGEEAIVSRMSLNDEINAKTEEHKYWNESSTGIPKLFTDPSGNFDSEKALTYVGSLGLSPAGEKALIGDIKTHSAAADAQLTQQAMKQQDDIVKAFHDHKYKEADALLDKYKQFSERYGNKFGESYKALTNYGDELKLHTLSVAIDMGRLKSEQQQAQNIQWQQQSFEALGQVQLDINSGHKYTDTELRGMAGRGPGKMSATQVNEAIQLAHSYENDPENRPFYQAIAKEDMAPETRGEIGSEFTSFLQKNPKASSVEKSAKIRQLLDPVHTDQIDKGIAQALKKINAVEGGQSAPAAVEPQENVDEVTLPSGETVSRGASQTMVVPNPRGLVEPGNILINNRPVVHNADGSRSTEYSISMQDSDGSEVLVPTVVNGKFLTPDGKKPAEGSAAEKAMFKAAWRHYKSTGENLGKFKTAADADAYAKQLHERGDAKRGPAVGTVEGGYRFNGGDPADKSNWEKVKK